ncbi:MAG: 3'-5' exonuclease, partial [Gammaproteobacteria bacterium]|nr:3'-5' exonuclease [Gammaproteobacteria bacterium]
GELLHRQDSTSQPGMEGLLKWFSRQRQDEGTRDEERLLRLESESNLVKVVTQHGSKGLQYPVVFCPFLWDASPRGGRSMKAYLFHDPGAAFRPIFELGSSEFARHRRFLREEELAEDVRLLYVALTRARYRCYLPWGKTKNSEHSALAWLLHPADTHEGQSLDDWQAAFQQLTPADMTHRLEYLVARSGGQISLEPLPKAVAAGQLSLELPPDLLPARNFSGVIRETGWVSSFSSLTAGQTLELADHDAVSLAADERRMEAPGTIHGFPRGAQPGSCLHAIFEELDFCSECAGQVARLVEAKLAAYAIEPHWQTVVSKMLSAVLNTPLNDAGLLLRDIPSNQRINEMEFLYPVHQLDCRRLSALAREHGFARSGEFASVIGQLDFRRAEGFMKGFIDLIIEADGCYYLLDYKSNWLGEDRSWYTQPHLHAAMLAHHYPLQYLFYVLALHRYLKYRLSDYDYDVHFGGVFYLFLRGMSPDTGPHCGVFYERPPASFILALDQWLTEADA